MKHNWIGLLLAFCLLLSVSGCASEQQGNGKTTSQKRQIIATAEVYRSIYEGVYPGNQEAVNLTDETMTEILSCLGKQGYVAVDFSNRFAMENTDLVLQFFDDMEAGTDAHIAIYQVCWDGGFVCHDLSYADGNTSVVLTSLAWLSEGPYALPGDIPTIRYSNEYEVTDILYSADGYLEYTYYMPDNPPGTNHDGHIDTTYKIAVSAT